MRRFLILIVFFFHTEAFSQEYLTKDGEVVFLSKAPLNEFEGRSNSLNGLVNLESNLLDFFVDLNTLKTGIGLRDRHMRENYLETDQFPFAEFTGKMSPMPTLVLGSKTAVNAQGKFKIHGVEREIEVTGFLTLLQNGKVELHASFEVLLSDYEIPLPKLVFYELAEAQTVTIQAILSQKKFP
ncbi:YceI family protein [Algoriphagus litoralis]|uniref:YceI family protein n=1 Tax=Algoriphagus litoralis TaxID=2202829 RepID=UPI000DB997C4|nr:YceI family protein [Algoriphagus litoralis]